MKNSDKIREYFEKDGADFNASYSNPQKIKDIVRRLSYWYSKKPIEGRLTALLDLIGNNIKNVKILEVGCGPGFYSIRLAEKGAKITGIDYSKGMVDIAKYNAQQAGVEVNFKMADFLKVELGTTFDYVFATGVIEYIEPSQQPAFLQKMTDLSNSIVIISFPKKYVLHALIRTIWLRFFKKIKISFFLEKDISYLSSICGLREIERRDIGILWVIKFKKIENINEIRSN